MDAVTVADRLTVNDNAAAYGKQNVHRLCGFAIRDSARDTDFRYLRDCRSTGS